MNEHILLVEDEKDIADALELQLTNSSYKVTVINDGRKALDFIQCYGDGPTEDGGPPISLYLLDRMLPHVSGMEICRFLRLYAPTKYHPILLVTALTGPEQIIEGLDAGADDYITKPFDISILMARVRALLRRYQKINLESSTFKDNILTLQNIKINTEQCKTWNGDEEVDLTLSEYKILLIFLQQPGKVMTRNQLVESVQDGPVFVTHRTIDTHIFGLRKKLKDSAQLIETVRGIGYRVVSPL